MSVVESSDATFNNDILATGVTVVDFWAPWCGPCRAFAPVFAASAQATPGVRHVKVNVDENPGLSDYFSVSSIPTIAVLREGYVLTSVAGALSPSGLAELIEKAEAVDMESVREASAHS